MENSLIQDLSLLQMLPDNWRILPFDQVIQDVSGGNKKTQKSEFLPTGSIPVIDQGKEFIAGYTDNQDCELKLPTPYIVFGDHTRALKFVDFKFAMGADGTKVLKIKKGVDAIEKYVYYFFKTLNIPETGYNRHFKYLKDSVIPLPDLTTQHKIAALLDKADELRQYNKQLIEKYDTLTQSLFLDMFGDPVRNEKGWEKVRFDELVSKECPLTYGIVQPGEEFLNGVPCVRPVDLITQYITVNSLKKIDPKISSKFHRTLLKGGELLLSVRGSVGVISVADESLKGSNVTRGIVPIWFESNISNKIFFYYLYRTMEVQREIKSLAKGATLIQINLKDLREVKMIKPPIALQNQFAERVQLIEQQKELAQQALQKSEELFNSLLQKAFKGELVHEYEL